MSKYRQCQNSLALEWKTYTQMQINLTFHQFTPHNQNIHHEYITQKTQKVVCPVFPSDLFLNYHYNQLHTGNKLLLWQLTISLPISGLFWSSFFLCNTSISSSHPSHPKSSVISSRKISLRFLTNHSFYNTSSLT